MKGDMTSDTLVMVAVATAVVLAMLGAWAQLSGNLLTQEALQLIQ
jgi:hypothetical protein